MCKNPLYKNLTLTDYNKLTNYADFKKGNAIMIKCGKCFNCLLKKIKTVESRFHLHIKHLNETKQKYYAYFITLTYDNKNIYKTTTQSSKEEIQKLLKRIRKNYKLKNMKYVCTTEIGGKTGRIHHHMFLLSDKNFLPKQSGGKRLKNGYYYYQCKNITWDNGFHSIKQINTDNFDNIKKSLSYVLKYIFKSPVTLMISKKIGYDAIKKIENPTDNTYIYNGYKYRAPWAKNELPNVEKIRLNQLMNKNPKKPKYLEPYDKSIEEPEEWTN